MKLPCISIPGFIYFAFKTAAIPLISITLEGLKSSQSREIFSPGGISAPKKEIGGGSIALSPNPNLYYFNTY